MRPDYGDMSRTAVPSDEMWARIEPSLPPVKGVMGRPMRAHRTLIEGSIYRLRTGCAWRDLPAEFGPWQTVWKRHARFCKDGTWDAVLMSLQFEADASGEIDWNVSFDSTIARVHHHGETAARSEVTVTAHTHRGLDRTTRNRWVAGTNRTRACQAFV